MTVALLPVHQSVRVVACIKVLFIVISYFLGLFFLFHFFKLRKTSDTLLKSVYVYYSFIFFLAAAVVFAHFVNDNKEKIYAYAPYLDFRKTNIVKDEAAISSTMIETVSIKNSVKLDAPLIKQLPELPRGCEVTALGMLLAYHGIHVDKMELAENVRRNPAKYRKVAGNIHFGNPHNGFVGDMYSFDRPGLGVYHEPIAELAEKYAGDKTIEDFTGEDFDRIIHHLNHNRPVWVIINSWYKALPENQFEVWHTEDGPIKITYRLHSVLVTGYDENYIYFNDPLNYRNKADKENFIKAWEQMGKQAITIH